MVTPAPPGNDPINVYHTRVRAHQTDLNAVMYHGAYFDVFDDARIETFRRLDYTYEHMVEEGFGTVIRRVTCEFALPARMDDLLQVQVLVPRLTTATMTIQYECRRDEQRLAMAEAIFAFVDPQGKPIRVPPGLRQVVERHAGVLGFTRTR